MAYTKQTWQDLPSKQTPINAARLGHMEDGIYDAAQAADTANTAIGNLPTFGTAAEKNSTNAVTQSSADLVESGAVYAECHALEQDISDTNLAVNAHTTAIQNLGIYKAEEDTISRVENGDTASALISAGEQFYHGNVLYTAPADIAQGASIVTSETGQNCVVSPKITAQLKVLADRVEKEHTIFGFHIDSTEADPSAMVTYLKDAVGCVPAHMDYTADKFDYGSWEDAFFMPRPCMLKYDGTVDYYLDRNDFSKKEDGVTASDIADASYGGNAMMEWGQNGKKIWTKIVPDANHYGADVFIADYKADDDFNDYCFHNCDGVSVDHFYTPIYNGSVIDSKMRSLSGQEVSKGLTGTAEMTAAQLNNTTAKKVWDIECFADRILINLLLVLMGKSVDTQFVFGQGANTGGTEAINNAFRTGVHNAKGLFYGTNSGTVASDNFANCVKVFGMENYYGFQWRRTNGLILSDGAIKYKMTRGTEDGSTASDYNTDGTNYKSSGATAFSGTSGNYIKTHYFTKDGMFPCGNLAGRSDSYYCDACWYNNSGARFAIFGGASSDGAWVGVFCCSLSNAVSRATWYLGAAVSCKPLAREGES